MKISQLKVVHQVHVPGVGQINSSGLTIDNSKHRDLTMEVCSDGVLLKVQGKVVLIPFSNVAFGIVAE